MRHSGSQCAVAWLMVTVVWTGCAEQGRPPADGEQASQEAASNELPEGHPPLSGSSGMTLPPVSPTAGIGESGLTWATPEGWQAEVPSSSMRRAQYRLPGEAGDGQCVVFYFGPGQGGDVESNILRWADEFDQPDGRSSRDLIARREIDAGTIPVTLVEVTGIHSGGMSPMAGGGQRQEGQMLLGAIASGPDANWFFKCTGPEATLRAQASEFEGLLRSLRTGVGS